MSMLNYFLQGGNPQMIANNILQKNPQFARALQGQNPKDLAMQEMQRRGIDPNQVMRMFNK
jgi:hypothetical protein